MLELDITLHWLGMYLACTRLYLFYCYVVCSIFFLNVNVTVDKRESPMTQNVENYNYSKTNLYDTTNV